MSEVQNQQRGDQQQAQDATGQVTGQVQDTAGQVTDQAQDVAGQAQDVAGQATDQAGQLVGQTQNVVGGLIGGGQGTSQSTSQPGEQEMEDYSYSDSDATTVENDKTPRGILGQLLNLDILPPPQSDTTNLDAGDTNEYYGPEEG